MQQHTRYWFVPKKYGYGMMPVTWQGWFVTAKFLTGFILIGFVDQIFLWNGGDPIVASSISGQTWLRFLLDCAFLFWIFFLFAMTKTKGEIRWRWGDND